MKTGSSPGNTDKTELRKEKERDFHNRLSSTNVRGKTNESYFISTGIKNAYDRFLDDICVDMTVLELGCAGGGRISRLAARGNSMIGIDISEAAINQAASEAVRSGENYMAEDLRFERMDAENMTFSDNTFDVVYGNGILHHLDLKKILKEICRVMKSDGTAVFIEPMGHNIFLRLYRKMTPTERTETEHPLTMSDIKLMKSLFGAVSVEYYYLFTMLAIPFRRFGFFNAFVRILEKFDRMIFHTIPIIGPQAWMALIVLKFPNK